MTLWDGGLGCGGEEPKRRRWGRVTEGTRARGDGACVGRGTGASDLGAGRGSVFHPDDKHTGVSSIFCW